MQKPLAVRIRYVNALAYGDHWIARDVLLGMLLVGADVCHHLRALIRELGVPPKLLAQAYVLVIYLHCTALLSRPEGCLLTLAQQIAGMPLDKGEKQSKALQRGGERGDFHKPCFEQVLHHGSVDHDFNEQRLSTADKAVRHANVQRVDTLQSTRHGPVERGTSSTDQAAETQQQTVRCTEACVQEQLGWFARQGA